MKDSRELWQSQNFLRNLEYVKKLVELSTIGTDDVVVEIGPGKGIITEQLAARAKQVIAVEYDRNLAFSLSKRFSDSQNVEIVGADFLEWKLPQIDYKVFSNIPFNMTADIVRKLTQSKNPPLEAYIIMQDRATERFIGEPASKNTQISILLKPFYDMSIVSKIDRREFQPVPNIDAVLMRFQIKDDPVIDLKEQQFFRDTVVYGFNQWKPTVLEGFEEIFSDRQLRKMAQTYGLNSLKPSELSVEQWVGIFDTLQQFGSENSKRRIRGYELMYEGKHKKREKQHRARRKR